MWKLAQIHRMVHIIVIWKKKDKLQIGNENRLQNCMPTIILRMQFMSGWDLEDNLKNEHHSPLLLISSLVLAMHQVLWGLEISLNTYNNLTTSEQSWYCDFVLWMRTDRLLLRVTQLLPWGPGLDPMQSCSISPFKLLLLLSLLTFECMGG